MSTSLMVPQPRIVGNRQFTRVVNETIKYASLQGLGSYSIAKSATDAIGSTVVTFDGVNAGSEIRVYLSDGTEAAGIELCSANQPLTWPIYEIGSANNIVTIRIVHPQYKIKEFQYTASIGAQTIPIQQELDKWYSNPA